MAVVAVVAASGVVTALYVGRKAVDWGNVAEWFGGLVTGGGLLVAAYQVREGRRAEQRRQQVQQEAYARSVSIGGMSFGASVGRPRAAREVNALLKNVGPLPIFEVQVDVLLAGRRLGTCRVGTVAAASAAEVKVIVEKGALGQVASDDQLAAEIRFRDAFGDVWSSCDGRLLRKL